MQVPNNRKLGFSLIELLVVIAIIGVLAALLFPVFVTAKRKARESASLSMIRQNAFATIQYAADFDDRWPFALGANCYSLGENFGKFCGALSPQEIQSMIPVNTVLTKYGVQSELGRSPVDRMNTELLEEGGHAETWWKETTTTLYPGSSFEYRGFDQQDRQVRPASEKVVLLYFTLFRLNETGNRAHQVAYSDGHSRAISESQLGQELITE